MSAKELAEVTRLGNIITNFDEGVRGVDVAIDITHEPNKGAAGWIKSLETGESTSVPGKKALWATIEWTPGGIELIESATFKYISAEFGDDTNAETKKITEDVLRAATMTNRPFVKGMAAVELDEDGNPPLRIEILREGDFAHPKYGEFIIKAEEGKDSSVQRFISAVLSVLGKETPPNLPKALGEQPLNEVENMDDIRALLTERGIELAEDADVMEALKAHLVSLDTPSDPKVLEEANAAVKLAEDNVKALEEAETANAKLLEENATLDGRLKMLEETGRVTKRDSFLAGAIRAGKLRPADLKKLEELYDGAPEQVEALLNDGPIVVDLGPEDGSDSDDSPKDEDDADLKAAKALSEKKSITLEEAYAEVIALGEGE